MQKRAEAKAALEQEAKERAEQEKAAVEARLEQRRKQEQERGKKLGGRPPEAPDPEQAKPEPQAQRNFTDPDSRIMGDGATKSFRQAYNAQAAVDSHSQIIVAAAITQETNDKKQLAPMLQQVEQNLGRKPEQATAEAGYFSEAAVTDPSVKEVELLVAPDRQRHGKRWEKTGAVMPDAPQAAPEQQRREEGPSAEGTVSQNRIVEAMRQKLRTPEGQAVYKRRKAVVEPVFGQIKERRGFRSFLLRGLATVKAEWQIICLTPESGVKTTISGLERLELVDLAQCVVDQVAQERRFP